MVGRVQRDPRTPSLPDPAGQADVVEVQVGDQDAADVGDPAPMDSRPASRACQASSLPPAASISTRPPPAPNAYDDT